MKNVKTYSAKPTEVVRTWYIIDASQLPLGRVSTRIATLLTGKGKTMFTKHVDCGDYVVVINAKDLVVTGNKIQDKKYYRHSQYPGGIKEATLEERLEKDPTKVIKDSVKGMLPVNKLRSGRMLRLKVYPGSEHPHGPQNPTTLDLKEKK